ncbi:MAG: hypothetical protein WBQ26_11390 [Gemmatimonadaceae bacterium]|nr:hypothetical protein [Gemmatimonadaceae bacterium]
MRRFGITGALLLFAASSAVAQGGLSAGHLGAAFGVSLPTSSLSHEHSAGFNLAATAEYRAPLETVGVRGELFYEHFAAKPQAVGAHSVQATAAIVSAVYHIQGVSYHPYLIGGMGLYHVTASGTNPGFNGGLGIEIPLTGMTAYFEARLHKVLTNGSSYLSLPITFGLSF